MNNGKTFDESGSIIGVKGEGGKGVVKRNEGREWCRELLFQFEDGIEETTSYWIFLVKLQPKRGDIPLVVSALELYPFPI